MEPIQVALRKQYTHAQRTKLSLQIKKTINAGKCCVRTVIFQRLMRENDSSRNDGGEKNSVIYMGLISGPNKADDTCGKTTVTGTMERGITIYRVGPAKELPPGTLTSHPLGA
jgi:hypothetical protein